MTSSTAHGFPLALSTLVCILLVQSGVALKQTTPYGVHKVMHLKRNVGDASCDASKNGFGFLAGSHMKQMLCRDYEKGSTKVSERIAAPAEMQIDNTTKTVITANPRHFVCDEDAPGENEWMWAKQCTVYGMHPMIAKDAGEFAVACGYGNLLGSYCFMSGHCQDRSLNENTTIGTAVAYCDARYGNAEWTSVGFKDAEKQLTDDVLRDGMNDDSLALMMTYDKVFCATGSYHCAAYYCQESFCKDPEYIAKFGHLQ